MLYSNCSRKSTNISHTHVNKYSYYITAIQYNLYLLEFYDFYCAKKKTTTTTTAKTIKIFLPNSSNIYFIH